MAFKWLNSVGFIIFRAHSQNNSAPRQFQRVFLKSKIRLAKRSTLPENDTFKAVVPDDATP